MTVYIKASNVFVTFRRKVEYLVQSCVELILTLRLSLACMQLHYSHEFIATFREVFAKIIDNLGSVVIAPLFPAAK
jgi:hypothetical protein